MCNVLILFGISLVGRKGRPFLFAEWHRSFSLKLILMLMVSLLLTKITSKKCSSFWKWKWRSLFDTFYCFRMERKMADEMNDKKKNSKYNFTTKIFRRTRNHSNYLRGLNSCNAKEYYFTNICHELNEWQRSETFFLRHSLEIAQNSYLNNDYYYYFIFSSLTFLFFSFLVNRIPSKMFLSLTCVFR